MYLLYSRKLLGHILILQLNDNFNLPYFHDQTICNYCIIFRRNCWMKAFLNMSLNIHNGYFYCFFFLLTNCTSYIWWYSYTTSWTKDTEKNSAKIAYTKLHAFSKHSSQIISLKSVGWLEWVKVFLIKPWNSFKQKADSYCSSVEQVLGSSVF